MVLLSNGEPIATPDDMKSKKVRVFGKWLGEWVDTVGGAPTLISGSEQFLAYQRGTVDVGMTGVSGVAARSLWDVMDTITRVNVADIEFIVVVEPGLVGRPLRAGADVDQRGGRRAEKAVRDDVSQIEADAYALAKENGMTVYDPTAEEIEAWKTASQPVIEKWLSESGDLGQTVYDAANNL